MKVCVVIFDKAQEWHACICSRLFGFWTIKIQFTGYNLLDGFLKEANKCIIDEAGGVMCATPEGMGHHIL